MKRNDATIQDWQENEALRRYQLIAPLLDDTLDEAKKLRLRKEIADRSETTVRTLYRYEKAWQEDGFQGLKPAERTNTQAKRLPTEFGTLLQEAIQLRREVPERSVEQIIRILELEGKAAPGVLKRPTLQRHLYNAG